VVELAPDLVDQPRQPEPPQQRSGHDAQKPDAHLERVVGYHEGKVGKAGHEEQDNQRVRERNEEGRNAVVYQRTFVVARLVHVFCRVRAVSVPPEEQQHDAACQLQVKPVLLVVYDVHYKTHAESCKSCIDNITDGCPDARNESVPAAFVQRALDTKYTDRTHGSRSNNTDKDSFEYKIQYIYWYVKWHNGCKIAKNIRDIQDFSTKTLSNPIFFPNFVGQKNNLSNVTIIIMNAQPVIKPYVIGLDLGGTNSVFGIVDSRGDIKATTAIKTQGYTTAEEYVEAAVEALQIIIDQVGGIEKIKAMGIGAPNGNYYNGTIETAPNIVWAHDSIVPLAKLFSDALHIPVAVTNDANAAAIGEMAYGVARGMKNFIVITLGTGVGSGIVVNGQLVYGSDGFAGELGHVTMVRDSDARSCGCGRSGCLEAYCSATGVARTAREMLAKADTPSLLREMNPEDITSLDVAIAAGKGDKLANEIYEFTGKMLGEACADFATFCSPEAFIFFGGMVKAGDLIMNPVKQAYNEHVMNVFKGKAQFLVSGLDGASAAVLGASAIGWDIQ